MRVLYDISASLVQFMDMHPQLKCCPKEVHFFDLFYDKGIEWYRNQMPLSSPEQLTVEKTPNYFFAGKVDTTERIHAFNSSVKLVLIAGDPSRRLVSYYVHFRSGKRP